MNTKSINLLFFLILILYSVALISAEDIVVERDGKISSTWGFDVGFPNETKPFSINEPGKMIYNHNGNEKREYDGVKGNFTFKDKKLKEADFTTTKDSEYAFGNQKVKVPKGAHVIFKDNKVTVELPKDALIEKPNKIPNSKDEDVKVEYRYKQGEEPDKIKIKDNSKEYEIKKFGSNKFQVNYDGKADAFKVDGKFEMNGLRVGEYSKDDETYLFFDGNAHDDLKGSYISIGDKKILVGASAGSFSSTVQFLPGNGILTVDDKKLVMIQAIGGEKGGSLKVESRDPQGMIPKITAQTGYNFFSGDKVLKYVDSYKDKYKGPILLTKNPISASGKESIPIQIVTLDKAGSRIADWDVIVDSYGSIKAGTASQLEGQLSSIRQGLVTSIRTGFHGLTKEEQAKIGTLSPEKQRELAGSDINKLRDELKKVPQIKVETDKTPSNPTTPTNNPPSNNGGKVNPGDTIGGGTTNPPANSGTSGKPNPKMGNVVNQGDLDTIKSSMEKQGVVLGTTLKNTEVSLNKLKLGGQTRDAFVFNGNIAFGIGNKNEKFTGKMAVTNEGIYAFTKESSTSNNKVWKKVRSL